MSDISRRKADHLDLAAHGDVAFHETTTLLECVRLVHQALPDLTFGELDTSTAILGKTLRAPLLIAAMTGGTERAKYINKELASIAEERGYAFGLGSQRAMQKNRGAVDSYFVRDVAPSALILGNVGVVQAKQTSTQELEDLVGSVGADALCVHLNPAMELIQSDGDRDFSGGTETLARLVDELSVPVVAKETGCGLSPAVLKTLKKVGVLHVDVSGAGGTSWVGVETRRAEGERRRLGEVFWDWGIPTAASVAFAARVGFSTVFATGGIQSGLDVAKSLALGASAAGIARHALRALEEGGRAGALEYLGGVELQLKTAMLLTEQRRASTLRDAERVVSGELEHWLAQL
jgi:isopentenyl-diphosphate delta-isomerase